MLIRKLAVDYQSLLFVQQCDSSGGKASTIYLYSGSVGEMAQQLRTLAALEENPGSVPSILAVQPRFWPLPALPSHIHTSRQNTHTHKVKIIP